MIIVHVTYQPYLFQSILCGSQSVICSSGFQPCAMKAIYPAGFHSSQTPQQLILPPTMKSCRLLFLSGTWLRAIDVYMYFFTQCCRKTPGPHIPPILRRTRTLCLIHPRSGYSSWGVGRHAESSSSLFWLCTGWGPDSGSSLRMLILLCLLTPIISVICDSFVSSGTLHRTVALNHKLLRLNSLQVFIATKH